MTTNTKRIRPVISFRIDKDLQEQWRALCYMEDVEQTTAFTRILKYMIQANNLESVRLIIRGN
jgi:hypothetical protein